MSDTRSGSTLLQNILSTGPGMITVGELYHLDSFINKGRWGRTWNWQCTCGKSFSECSFWNPVLKALQGQGFDKIERTEIIPTQHNGLNKVIRCDYDLDGKNRKTLDLLNAVFSAIFEVSGAEVVIDSSKSPVQGLALYQQLGFKVKVIYLKRDIRAVAMSKQKWQSKLMNRDVNSYKILFRNKIYDLRCRNALKQIAPEDMISITYEDLARTPQKVVDRITHTLDLNGFRVPEFMQLDKDHAVGGTPNREGKRAISYDDSWERKTTNRPVFRMFGQLVDRI